MKKVIVIAILLGLMVFLSSLGDAILGSGAITLATIGFVVLAAFAVAELGKSVSLPQVTGYILAGVAMGPSVANLVSGNVVSEMKMFNTLALGLIATSAGLELDIKQTIALGKTLVCTIAAKLVVGVAAVALALIGLDSMLGSLGLDPGPQLYAVGLIMGVLSIGTSPAIVLAVLAETKAKGRLSDLVLGAAIFKDLVVVVALAIGIAVAKTMVVAGASLDSSVLVHVGQELGGSIVAGGLVGAIFIAYIRFVKAEMLLFVAAMILVVAELCRVMHLELLLVFIAAGFVVRNFSKYEHDLMKPLETVALPVFVVFFTNAGASIDLLTTWQILPLALAVCATRAAAYYVSGRFGARIGGESEAVAKNAWIAYLPQAGVTLGLVGLAALKLPALATPISNMGMAVVAINLLVGPIALRQGLSAAGNLPDTGKKKTEDGQTDKPDSERPRARIQSRQLPEELELLFARAGEETHAILRLFTRKVVPTLPMLPELDQSPSVDDFRSLVRAHRTAYQRLYSELSDNLGQLPIDVTVSLPSEERKEHLAVAKLSPLSRLGWTLFPPTKRRVPVRRIARICLEPAFASLVKGMFDAGLQRRVLVTEVDIPRLTYVKEEPTVAMEDPIANASIPPMARLGEDTLLDAAFQQLRKLLATTNTPLRASRSLRYSTVDPQIRHTLGALSDESDDRLSRIAHSAWGRLLVEERASEVCENVQKVVTNTVRRPALTIGKRVNPSLTALQNALEEGVETYRTLPPRERAAEWRKEFGRRLKLATSEVAREFRASATVRSSTQQLREQLSSLPGPIPCLDGGKERRLEAGRVRHINLLRSSESMVRLVIPVVDSTVRSVSNALAQLQRRITETLEPEWNALEAEAEQLSAEDFDARVEERFSQMKSRLNLVERTTDRSIDSALKALDTGMEQANQQLWAELSPKQTDNTKRQEGLKLLLEQTQTLTHRLFHLVTHTQWYRRAVQTTRASDASTLRDAWQPPKLPQHFTRWFQQHPVTDERIFTARREVLETILDSETHWSENRPTATLLLGRPGCGKSSLLNMCELELRNNTPLKLHPKDYPGTTTLIEALAQNIGCRPNARNIRRHLALKRPAVLVDEFGTWFRRSAFRRDELDEVLHLIARSRGIAFWVIAMGSDMLRLATELQPLEDVFTRIVELDPLSASDLERVIEARLDRCGTQVFHVAGVVSQVTGRIGLGTEKERFFRVLRRCSGGNPGRALALYQHAVHLKGTDLHVHTGHLWRRSPQLQSLLSPTQLALVTVLHRYGSQTSVVLRRELAMTPEQVHRNIAYLVAAGIIERAPNTQTYAVCDQARWSVIDVVASQA